MKSASGFDTRCIACRLSILLPGLLFAGFAVAVGGRPWKIGGEINYYVEQPDPFGPEWMLSFSAAPVVKNALAEWFK